MTTGRNTRLHYLYRDASNYKAYGHVVLAGDLTTDDGDRKNTNQTNQNNQGDAGDRFELLLLDSLPRDPFGAAVFVPDQVGLPNLRHRLPGHYDDDTNWNVIVGVEPTDDPTTHAMSIGEFIAACLTVERWDPETRTDASWIHPA